MILLHISKNIMVVLVSSAILLIAGVSIAEDNTILPRKKSELDGWNGIKIMKGGACGRNCCQLIFPKDFGFRNKRQLRILKQLVINSRYFEHDVDCWMPVNHFTLNHILYLAVERQDAEAARFLIDRSNYNSLNLSGEFDEEYSGDYELPVLEKFKDIKSIVSEKNEILLAGSICAWAVPSYEVRRINKLISHLSNEGMKKFSNLIKRKCAAVKSEMNGH